MGGCVRAVLLLSLGCGACGIISGLDNLSTDGGADAAQGDGGMTNDAQADADTGVPLVDGGGMDASALCEYTGGNPHCFPTVCPDADVCCVGSGTTSPICQAPTSCIGMQLGCTSPEDCPSGNKCCFADVGSLTAGCPTTVVPSPTTKSFCTTQACAMPDWRVCVVDSDCLTGHTCHQAVVQGAAKSVFGLCY